LHSCERVAPPHFALMHWFCCHASDLSHSVAIKVDFYPPAVSDCDLLDVTPLWPVVQYVHELHGIIADVV